MPVWVQIPPSAPTGVPQNLNWGDVAKWTKAEVCKTSIRRFESARRLQPHSIPDQHQHLSTRIPLKHSLHTYASFSGKACWIPAFAGMTGGCGYIWGAHYSGPLRLIPVDEHHKGPASGPFL